MFRRQSTLRVCSHPPPELAIGLVAEPRCARSRCVAAGVRSCQGFEVLPPSPCMWPASSATRIAIGHRAPTRMPHRASPSCLRCGPDIGCCDTPGRLRLVRTLLAVHRRTVAISTLLFQSFTRNLQSNICLDLLIGCCIIYRGLLISSSSRFGYYGILLVAFNGVHVGR